MSDLVVSSPSRYRQEYSGANQGRRTVPHSTGIKRLGQLLWQAFSQFFPEPPLHWPLIGCSRTTPRDIVPKTLSQYPALRNLLDAKSVICRNQTVSFELPGVEEAFKQFTTVGRAIVYANPRHSRNLNQWLKYTKFIGLGSVFLIPLAPYVVSILLYTSIFTPGIGVGTAFLNLFLAQFCFSSPLALGLAWGVDKLINEPIILRPGKQGEKFLSDLHTLTQEVLNVVNHPNLDQAYKAETIKNFAQVLALVFTNFCSSVDDNTALWWRTVLCRSGLYATQHGFNLMELTKLVRLYHGYQQSNPKPLSLSQFCDAKIKPNYLNDTLDSLRQDLDNLGQTCLNIMQGAANISRETIDRLNVINQQISDLKHILNMLQNCPNPEQAFSLLGDYDAIVNSLYENVTLVFPPDLLNSASSSSGQINLSGFSFDPSSFMLNVSQETAADLPGIWSQIQPLTKVFGAKPRGVTGLVRRALALVFKGEPSSALDPAFNFPSYMETHRFFSMMGQLANIVVPLMLLGRHLDANNYSSFEALLLGQNGLIPYLAKLTAPDGVLMAPDPVIGNLGRGTSLFGASLIHYLSPGAYWGHLATSLLGVVQRKIQNR